MHHARIYNLLYQLSDNLLLCCDMLWKVNFNFSSQIIKKQFKKSKKQFKNSCLSIRYCFVYNLKLLSGKTHHINHKEAEKNCRKKILSVIAVGLSTFWSVTPIFGWNRYTLEIDHISCSLNWSERSLNVISYNISSFVAIYLIPLILIVWTNYETFRIVSIYNLVNHVWPFTALFKAT